VTHRLLVVEDEEHLAAGLKLNLELEGYEVDVAVTAREAGEHLLRADAYDAIVLDVQLPDIDGFEVAERLRAAGESSAIVLTSTRESSDFGEEVAASPTQGFVTKGELSGAALTALIG
jgi:DNA-binding response OmpR family regulator